jgi:chloramphenicol 3-O phosphotransferase
MNRATSVTMRIIPAMANILDEVFLSGAAAQKCWATVLHGLSALWVGIWCDPHVAAAREATCGDRVLGMPASQAALVHQGVIYDLEIDTTRTFPRAALRSLSIESG